MTKTTQPKPDAPDQWIKPCTEILNRKFNAFPNGLKKSILILTGIIIAILSGTMIHNAIHNVPSNPFSTDKITLPKDIHMPYPDTQTLTPVGKMKGEIKDEFEAFYLAVDAEGQVFINRDPEYGEDRYNKSKGWEPITREQLQAYEKHLHFIPHQKKSLKP